MSANNFQSSGDSSDTPSVDSGAFEFEAALAREITPTQSMFPGSADYERPQITRKGANLDETFCLMNELNDLREGKQRAEEMTEMMGQDLFQAKEEIEEKDNKLNENEKKLREYEEQVMVWQTKAQNLSDEVQQANTKIAEITQANDIHEKAVSSGAGNLLQTTQELFNAQEQVAQLEATISKKDAEMTGMIGLAAGKAYDHWQAVFSKKELEFESEQKENRERVAADLKKEKQRRHEAEEALRDLSQQLDTNADQEQKLRQAAETSLHDVREKLETASRQMSQEQQLRDAAEALLRNIRSELETTSNQLCREQERRSATESIVQDMKSRSDSSSTQLAQEEELRHAAEAALQRAKTEHEAKFREAASNANIHIAELQRRVQEAEAAMQEQVNCMEVQVEQEQLLQRISSLEAELAGQRQRCKFLQRNSERLSKESKEVQALKREIEMGGQRVSSRA